MKTLGGVVATLLWVSGWIIAKGFWSTFFAVIFPLWGYYLVTERAVERFL